MRALVLAKLAMLISMSSAQSLLRWRVRAISAETLDTSPSVTTTISDGSRGRSEASSPLALQRPGLRTQIAIPTRFVCQREQDTSSQSSTPSQRTQTPNICTISISYGSWAYRRWRRSEPQQRICRLCVAWRMWCTCACR